MPKTLLVMNRRAKLDPDGAPYVILIEEFTRGNVLGNSRRTLEPTWNIVSDHFGSRSLRSRKKLHRTSYFSLQ